MSPGWIESICVTSLAGERHLGVSTLSATELSHVSLQRCGPLAQKEDFMFDVDSHTKQTTHKLTKKILPLVYP